MVLPPMEASVKSKFLILRVGSANWPTDPQDFQRVMRRCEVEIPAWLHWLENEFALPPELYHARFWGGSLAPSVAGDGVGGSASVAAADGTD